MRRRNNTTSITTHYDQDIRDLTEAVNQLRLAQSRLDAVRARVEHNRDRRKLEERGGQAVLIRRRTVHPLSRFIAGDYVRVKNPKRGQPDRGIVFGATRSALVQLRVANGEEVKRLSKNLELLESADERERTEASGSGSNVGQ